MTADPLSALLQHDRAIVLGVLAAVGAGAGVFLLLGAGLPAETMQMGSGQMLLMQPKWPLGYGSAIFAMWVVMMVAMILPSAALAVLVLIEKTMPWGSRTTRISSIVLAVWGITTLAAAI